MGRFSGSVRHRSKKRGLPVDAPPVARIAMIPCGVSGCPTRIDADEGYFVCRRHFKLFPPHLQQAFHRSQSQSASPAERGAAVLAALDFLDAKQGQMTTLFDEEKDSQ